MGGNHVFALNKLGLSKIAGMIGVAAIGVMGLGATAKAETTIRLATALPDDGALMKAVFRPWIDELNEKGKGIFKIQTFPPPFATGTNVWDRTKQGVADMGLIVIPATGLPFSSTMVTTIPDSGHDIRAASAALWQLYDEGLLAGEYDDVHLLSLTTVPPLVFISSKEVDSLDDIKGLRVRVNDQNGAAAMTALGAAPVALPFSEAYQGFSRGVVDGGVANGITILGFRFSDVAKYQIRNVEFGMPPTAIVMNKRFYEGLSPEAKAIFAEVSGRAGSIDIAERQHQHDLDNLSQLEKLEAYKIVVLDEAERQKWRDGMAGVAKDWAANTPNGAKVLERYKAAYEAALKEFPAQ